MAGSEWSQGGEATEAVALGGMPSTALAGAVVPGSATISDGVSVFQSAHHGQFINNGTVAVQVVLTASLRDGNGDGHTSVVTDVAQPGVPLSMQPVLCAIATANYASGSRVALTGYTQVAGGGAAHEDVQHTTLTVP